jgi:hypothetical protein
VGKAKSYGHNLALAGSIPLPRLGDNDIWITNFTTNKIVDQVVELLAQEYPNDYNQFA